MVKISSHSLRAQLRKCKENRLKLIQHYELLNEQYRKGIISYKELENYYTQKIGDKTAQQWVEFYNEKINDYKNQLNQLENSKYFVNNPGEEFLG